MKTFWNLGAKLIETLQTLGEITVLLVNLAFEEDGATDKISEKIAGRYDKFKSALKKTVFWIIFASIVLAGAGVVLHSHILLIIAATIVGLCASYIGIAFSVFSLVLGFIFEKGDKEKAAIWGKKILGVMFSFLVWEYIVLMFALIAPPWRNPAAAVLAAISGIALALMRGAWGGTEKNRHHSVLRGIAVILLLISMPAIWFPHASQAFSKNTDRLDVKLAENIDQHGIIKGAKIAILGTPDVQAKAELTTKPLLINAMQVPDDMLIHGQTKNAEKRVKGPGWEYRLVPDNPDDAVAINLGFFVLEENLRRQRAEVRLIARYPANEWGIAPYDCLSGAIAPLSKDDFGRQVQMEAARTISYKIEERPPQFARRR